MISCCYGCVLRNKHILLYLKLTVRAYTDQRSHLCHNSTIYLHIYWSFVIMTIIIVTSKIICNQTILYNYCLYLVFGSYFIFLIYDLKPIPFLSLFILSRVLLPMSFVPVFLRSFSFYLVNLHLAREFSLHSWYCLVMDVDHNGTCSFF